jgi:hypothetical protein
VKKTTAAATIQNGDVTVLGEPVAFATYNRLTLLSYSSVFTFLCGETFAERHNYFRIVTMTVNILF